MECRESFIGIAVQAHVSAVTTQAAAFKYQGADSQLNVESEEAVWKYPLSSAASTPSM